jgi:hypothetical protein
MTISCTCTQQSEFSHIITFIGSAQTGREKKAMMGIVFIGPHIFRNFQEALTVTYCEFIFQEKFMEHFIF